MGALQMLIHAGADTSCREKPPFNAGILAANEAQLDALSSLLQARASADHIFKNADFATMIKAAQTSDEVDKIRDSALHKLLEAGASANSILRDGSTPVCLTS